MQNRCFSWIKRFKKTFLLIISTFLSIIFLATYFLYFLPDIKGLPFTQWPSPMYIYTQEGELMAEFGPKQREVVTLDEVPLLLQQAFFAIEDRRFLEHHGIDVRGLLRASVELLITGRKSQGGSTITMQVARNYYLHRGKTFLRKIKEILLAIKIERYFTKKQILEFYFNKIYMGHRTFGLGTAAHFYCQKSYDQLTLAEMALLAGIPQAPALLNPISDVKAAKKRRDLVLYRLYYLGFIEKKDYVNALNEAIFVPEIEEKSNLWAPYVAEMTQEVAQQLLKEQANQGLHIYTTIESRAQRLADEAVLTSLLEYDQHHGYRGCEKRIENFQAANIQKNIAYLKRVPAINGLLPAVVMTFDGYCLTIMLKNGKIVTVQRKEWEWITKHKQSKSIHQFKPGDVVRVYQKNDRWHLGQIPNVQSALVALDPNNGAIKALIGGFSYTLSQFNRATRAKRQTGSSFKPFIYAAAFEKQYNLSDVFNDAPVVFDIPDKVMPWRPQNATHSFDGLTRLRVALVTSVNLVTIRLLQAIGIPYALKFIQRFGFDIKGWPSNLSLALGSIEATPLEMARSYAVFANGGYLITPHIVDHITDYEGRLLYQATPFKAGPIDDKNVQTNHLFADSDAKIAPRVISNDIAFLINSALKGVIPYSGKYIANYLGRKDLAGKTGTSNNSVDSWFIGYNSACVSSVWMGLDQRKSLYEYAHTTAFPLWARFMKPFLKEVKEKPLVKPKGIVVLPINVETGFPAQELVSNNVYEYFQSASLNRYRLAMKKSDHDEQSIPSIEVPLF